ncbi:AraC family transcriptional regulator [Microvirga sp. W0021]|uniref:AraC family transcriptional regulator n=1 Tax=Hohaiivirga grylli TaxID=3133970 RepID=A0ABV0BKH5_9HYPH
MRIDCEQARINLRDAVQKWMPSAGDYSSPIEGLSFYRRDHTTQAAHSYTTPRIVKLVQGSKHTFIGERLYIYGENEIIAAGVDMLGRSTITDASPEKPCMSLVLDIDADILTQLIRDIPPIGLPDSAPTQGMFVQKDDPMMLDALVRLVELQDQPEHIPVLAPMLIKEIHYRILIGPKGQLLRSFYTMGYQNNQISRAITLLKQKFNEPIKVEKLAEQANMAPSTFHRHFKEVTALSPLQYQKRLRLHEAQRLMLLEGIDASSACHSVGYENLSQFNREYKRHFGEPPRRDIRKRQSNPVLMFSSE